MVIRMDDYRKVTSTASENVSGYDEELLCANWNPEVKMVAPSHYPTPRDPAPALPENFTDTDVRAFMVRIAALASQS